MPTRIFSYPIFNSRGQNEYVHVIPKKIAIFKYYCPLTRHIFPFPRYMENTVFIYIRIVYIRITKLEILQKYELSKNHEAHLSTTQKNLLDFFSPVNFSHSTFTSKITCFLLNKLLGGEQCFLTAIYFKSNIFQIEYISNRTHFKSNTFQMEHISNGTHFKWNTFQMEHISNGTHFKWNTFQMEHISNGTHFKWNIFQIEHISNRFFLSCFSN